jgi:hypothetical protein
MLQQALPATNGASVLFLTPSKTEHERERLRKAQTALREAERILKERVADTARVRGMLDAVGEAEEKQKVAEEALRTAARAWGLIGASGESTPEIRALTEAAKNARDHTYATKLQVEGLQEALGAPEDHWRADSKKVLPAHAEAKFARDRALDELHTAIRKVLLAEMQPILDRAHAARAALAAEAPALASLFSVLRMSSGFYRWAGESAEVKKSLDQLLGPLPEQEAINAFLGGRGKDGAFPLAECWTDFAYALENDAEAALELLEPEGRVP